MRIGKNFQKELNILLIKYPTSIFIDYADQLRVFYLHNIINELGKETVLNTLKKLAIKYRNSIFFDRVFINSWIVDNYYEKQTSPLGKEFSQKLKNLIIYNYPNSKAAGYIRYKNNLKKYYEHESLK